MLSLFFSRWNGRNIKLLSDVQIAQVACGFWHSHALSRGEQGSIKPVQYTCFFWLVCLFYSPGGFLFAKTWPRCIRFPSQEAKSSLGAKISADNSGWEWAGRAFPRHIWSSLCWAFRLPRYQQVARTALPSPSQEQCLVGAGTSLVSLVSMTPMVGQGISDGEFWGSTRGKPWAPADYPTVLCRSSFPSPAEVLEVAESDLRLLWRRSHSCTDQVKCWPLLLRDLDMSLMCC